MSTILSHGCLLLARGFGPRRAISVATALLFSFAVGSVQAGERAREDLSWIPNAEVSLAETVLAQPAPIPSDGVHTDQQTARTWALHKIAVIQAAAGDIRGAETTVAQIDDRPRRGGDVTAVWFSGGRAVYNRPPVGEQNATPAVFSAGPYRPGYNYDGSIVPGFWLKDGQPVYGCPCACVTCPVPAQCRPCGLVAPLCPSQEPQEPATQRLGQAESHGPGWGARDAEGNRYFLTRDRPANHVPYKAPPGLPADYLARDPQHGAVVDFTDELDNQGVHLCSRTYADGYVVIETLPANRR